jgi:hypothetical protein
MLDQGRISDTHLDVSRSGLRRALKTEKGSQFWMRIFPDRPVTSKVNYCFMIGIEYLILGTVSSVIISLVRQGWERERVLILSLIQGYVDYYATWVARGKV